MNERDAGGYAVAYSQDETPFPVYLIAALGTGCLLAAFITGLTVWFALGVVAFAITYYNFPLLEPGRPAMGANQYGMFIQAFGLIRWRAIDSIDLVAIAERGNTAHELRIGLAAPLGSALVADWRKQPMYRSLMRLPWSMTFDNAVRIKLDPLDQPPDEIHRTLIRMWRYYRS